MQHSNSCMGYRENIDDCVSKNLKKPKSCGDISLELYLQEKISPGILADLLPCLSTRSGTIAKQKIKAEEERYGTIRSAFSFFRQIERFSGFGAQLLDALHYENQHDLADMIYKGPKYTPPTVDHNFQCAIQQLREKQFPVLPPPYKQVDEALSTTQPKTLPVPRPSSSDTAEQSEDNYTHQPTPLAQTKSPLNMDKILQDAQSPGVLQSVALEPNIVEITPPSSIMESSGPVMFSALSDVVHQDQSKVNLAGLQVDVGVSKGSEAGLDHSLLLPSDTGQQPECNSDQTPPARFHPNASQSLFSEIQPCPKTTLKPTEMSKAFEVVPSKLTVGKAPPYLSSQPIDADLPSHDKGKDYFASIARGALLFLTLDDYFS